jgi:GAF domain-containing protein/ActR/RegA family two-component response regulator
MRSSRWGLFFGVALGALALSALGAGGVAVTLRQISLAREQVAADAQESAAALVADAQAALGREARLLAREPALVDGVAKGDWATLARGVSPRLAGITLERVADFVSVLDAAGAALLQVPALPPVSVPNPAAISASPPGLTVLNGHPYVVAAVPVMGPASGDTAEARPAGFVIIARRLENVLPHAAGISTRPGLLFLDNGRAIVASLQHQPATDWLRVTAAGKLSLERGRDFLVRPADKVAVSGPGRLWVLVEDGSEGRRRALVRWLAGLGLCALASLAVALLLGREPAGRGRAAGRPGEAEPPDPNFELVRRIRELEALNAVALSTGRSADVVATAGEMLDAVRALAQMDVGGVHRLDPDGGTLTLIAQRGLTPELAAHIRVRPVDGSYVGDAARTGRLIVTHLDPSSLTDPWLSQLQAVRAHRTQLALPIPVKGQTWGVMSLISQEQRDFLSEEIKVLEAVAHQIGQVVERALLLAQMEEQSRRLETLARVGHSLTAARSLEDVLAAVVGAARGLVADGAARLAIAEGDRLRFCAEAGLLGRLVTERTDSLPFGEGVTGRAAVSHQPVVIDRIEASPEVVDLPWLRAEGFVSGVAVPLLVRERLVGVLNVFTRTPHAFVATDMDLLLSFASHAAIAIDNARLFAEAQQSAARYRALFEVSGALASSLNLDQILDAIVERVQGLTGAAAAGIFRADGETGLLTYARAAGVSAEFLRGLRVRLGEGTAGRAIRERSPVWTADILNDPAIPLSTDTRILVEREGYRGVLSVPIFIKGEPYGGLTVYWWQPHQVSAAEIEVMTALGGQAAVAIENARLFDDERSGRASLSVLLEVNKKIGLLVPTDTLLTGVAEEAMRLLDLDNAGFRLLEGDELVVAGLAGHAPESMLRPRIKVGESLAGKVVAEGRAVVGHLDSLPDLLPEHMAADRRLGYTHFMGLPLRVGERIIGVLMFRARRAFSRRDQETAEAFAGQAAVAIEHARLYREAAQQAERLRSLARLSQLVSSSLDTDEVLGGIARAAAVLMGVPVVSVWVADTEAETLHARAFSDEPMAATYPLRTMAFGQGAIGVVAMQRQVLSIPDALDDGRVLGESWWREHGLRSFLGVPILLQDQLLGVLALCGRAPFQLGPDERELLESFVAQAAVAIRNAGLYSQTAERLEQTRSLLEVAEILNSTLEQPRMLRQVGQRIAQVCGVDRCSIARWEGDHVVPLMSQFADGRKEPRLWVAFEALVDDLPREVPIHAQAIETRRPAIVADASDTDRIPRAWVEAFGIKSYMVVPLIRQDEVIGIMTLDYTERVTPFEPWQQDLGMAIGNQVALALENQRLYGLVQERLLEATTLLSVSRVLSEPDGSGEALRRVAAEVGRTLGADMVGVYTLSADKSALVAAAGWHVPKDLLETFTSRPFVLDRMPALRQLWEEGRAAWSSDVKNDPRIDQQVFEGIGSHSALFAPALAGGEPVGAVFLVWWGGGRSFTPREVRLLEAVASQVGLFMENTNLTRQTRLRLEESEALLSELSALHDLSRTVTGQLRQEDVVEAIHRQVARRLDAHFMVLSVVDETTEELVALLRMQDGVRDAQQVRRSVHARVGLMAGISTSGLPIRTDDYVGECARRGVEPAPANDALPYWIGVPMLAGTQVVGVLTLRSDQRPFSEADERVLTNIAGLAALALRSARLYQDRTRAYEELAQAQDQLIRSEKLRALGEMASGVAHDFNNLLAAILGRAQLLLRRVSDPTARQWLQIIERSAADGAKTVRRLQEFTRVRRDQPAVAVDLNQVVREALELTEPSWRLEPPRQGIVIEAVSNLAPDLPTTLSDPAELREVMTNLILNAVDAMPRGGTLSLSTARRGEFIEVRVADTGVGIPEAVRGKIFDPFFTTKGPRGTGLGLSMTYGILSRHGATIIVDSQEGQGTTFSLLFPVGGAPRQTVPDAGAPQPAVSLRCLVVDDEEAVGDMIADVLRSAGHTVTVARGASEGLSRVRSEPLDVVFTDLSMPGMTGWELARAVRDAVPGLPVILISGFAVEVSPEELEAGGVHSVLAKPINMGEVLDAASAIRPRREPRGGRP